MRKIILLLIFLLTAVPLAHANPLLGETSTYAREAGRDQLFFYVAAGDGVGQIEYICVAAAGTASSEAEWQVRKFSYDSSSRLSTIIWAANTDDYTQVCDDRASLSY